MEDQHPAVPAKVRDAVYIGGVISGAVTGLTVGVVAIWFPAISEQVNATGVVVSTFIAVVVGGLGTIYRPGAQS